MNAILISLNKTWKYLPLFPVSSFLRERLLGDLGILKRADEIGDDP
jgi:hypothetical protein